MLRTVFMGTPDFALPALEVVFERTDLALVVTQPDKPAGRGRRLQPPAVKVRAAELGVPVAQPLASVTSELGDRLLALEPELVVVAAFGKFLGRKVLGLPRLGCVNLHASLLPRHRGASPPAWAILAGDRVTGVTIQRMVPAMDEGELLAQVETAIESEETAGELTARLSALGAGLLREVLLALEAGEARATPQDHGAATLAPPLTKQDGLIRWERSAREVHDHVRAMNPWPMAYTTCPKGPLRVHRARLVSEVGVRGRPGAVVRADPGGLHVACGAGVVEILEAQREGKNVNCARDLVCGRMIQSEEVLGG